MAFNLLYVSAWATNINIPAIKQAILPMIQKSTYGVSILPSAVQPKHSKTQQQTTLPKYKEGEVIVKYKKTIQK